MITVRVYRGGDVKEVDAADLGSAVAEPGALVWADVSRPDDADLERIQTQLHLHPLAMEDVRQRLQRPKLEYYPTHGFVVAYTADLEEVDIFVGPTWLVSVCEAGANGDGWSLDQARGRFDRTHSNDLSPGFLLYVLLDEIVDGYFDATDRAEDALEKLEEDIFAEHVPDERVIQQELFDVRRRLLVFRRAVVPLRDVVGSLMRREASWIDETAATHLQDVYDHVLRAVDLLDGQHELMGNAVDDHLALISNRINGVMKTMTSWGAILLGASLVAGIYGMNFEHMPELGWGLGYVFALGVMALVTVVGYRYFRGKNWL
jgi:magnesium transporter